MELKVSADFDILKASFAFIIAILNQLSSDKQPNLIYFKKDCFDLGLKSNFDTESCSNWFRVVFIKIFYFFIKTFLSLRFQCIFKATKLKEEFSYNLAQNIWSHFESFLYTTNKLELDHYHQKVIVRVATWVGKPLKTYNLRKFRENSWNFWKSTLKTLTVALKNCKQSDPKHFTEKLILLISGICLQEYIYMCTGLKEFLLTFLNAKYIIPDIPIKM